MLPDYHLCLPSTLIGVENKKYPGPGKRRALDLLERELQAVVVWVVDINSGPLEDSNALFLDPPQLQETTSFMDSLKEA